jgi:hypothetical protein
MPQESPRPHWGTTPMRVKARPSGASTERFVLHAWILVILGALLWALLS